jgi:hypothetical protein
MRAIPPFCLFVLLAMLGACGDSEPPSGEPTASTLSLDSLPLTPGETYLITGGGDTLRLAILAPEDGRQRLVRVQRGETADSAAVVIDAATKVPLESFRLAVGVDGDTVSARIEYDRGFEGQARLTLTVRQGTGVENLRTPPPFLDAAQLPLTLAALPFGRLDSLHFNYVAPFEKRALAAFLLVGALDTLRIAGASVAAWPVHLQVSGLEERYWFPDQPPHAIVRLEEITRGRTWTRAEPPTP